MHYNQHDTTRHDTIVTDAQKSSKRKALIITIYAPENRRNFGCTLQHYALQEAVKLCGYETESLICQLIELPLSVRLREKIIGGSASFIKSVVKLVLAIGGSEKYRSFWRMKLASKPSHTRRRGKIFAEFYNEFIDSMIRTTYGEVLSAGKTFTDGRDIILTGSDQVWNKDIVRTDEALRFYYLSWAEKEKRVCYAPSYEEDDINIDPGDFQLHINGLEGFTRLSCREKSGCDLIRAFTGREAELVIDPTFMIAAEQWRKISRKPECDVPEHYILSYSGRNNLWKDIQRELAGGKEIVELLDPAQEYYRRVGPMEFIWLLDHADFIFTTAFHGTAFAVNMGKNFLSFMKTRKNDGRIGTLLSSAGLSSHIYEPRMTKLPDDIDYAAVNAKLDVLRESSLKYLRECLKV